MKIKKLVYRIAVVASVAAASSSAFAQFGGIVYDPSNWVQNNSSAIAAVKNEVNTAQALYQQVQSAISLAKSAAALKNITSMADVQQAMGLYTSLQNVDSQLASTLQRNMGMTQNLVAQYGASGLPWDQFFSSQTSIRTDERKATLARYDNINASLADTAAKRSQIVTQLGAVQGQTEALQTLGAALDVIIGQNQQIIVALKANSVSADNGAQRQEQSDAQLKAMMHQYQQQMRDSASKY